MTIALTSTGRWLVSHDPGKPNTHIVAYTVPAAGAGAAAHRMLATTAPAGMSTLTVRLPGREARFSEPPIHQMAALVADTGLRLAAHARDHGMPFVLVGECVGAYVAYELGRFLLGEGLRPAGLVVIGQRGPADGHSEDMLHDLPAEQFRQALCDRGFIAPEVGADADLFALFEPTLRADWAVAHDYEWQPDQSVDFPISVVARGRDGATAAELRDSWAPTTHGRTTVVTSIVEGCSDELDAISVELTRVLSVASAGSGN
jgi:medium-chain acyl-[acyl-carrier-protein] hydrolase